MNYGRDFLLLYCCVWHWDPTRLMLWAVFVFVKCDGYVLKHWEDILVWSNMPFFTLNVYCKDIIADIFLYVIGLCKVRWICWWFPSHFSSILLMLCYFENLRFHWFKFVYSSVSMYPEPPTEWVFEKTKILCLSYFIFEPYFSFVKSLLFTCMYLRILIDQFWYDYMVLMKIQ